MIGRSDIVGKPMAVLLLGRGLDATVTVCHSRTRDLPALTRQADILVAAIGRAGFVTADMVKPGAVVIDVGINRVDDADREPATASRATSTSRPSSRSPARSRPCQAASDR